MAPDRPADPRPADPRPADPVSTSASPEGIRIALDGPAASGKGTVARAVARALGYRYLDTGAMYRALALEADRRGVAWTDAPALAAIADGLQLDFRWDGEALAVLLGGVDVSQQIRTQRVGQGASAVAVHPPVRAALVRRQQALAARGGVVVDGRDIGTVVLPGAELKVFLDASPDERARRRHAELLARDPAGAPSRLEVKRDVDQRDAQDSGRATGPLRVAQDAVVIDTTRLDIDQAVAAVVALARSRGA